MNWETYMSFPVAYKHWLVKRIEKEISKAHEAGSDIPSKGAHQNTPDARAWAGKFKTSQTNAKTWRAT